MTWNCRFWQNELGWWNLSCPFILRSWWLWLNYKDYKDLTPMTLLCISGLRSIIYSAQMTESMTCESPGRLESPANLLTQVSRIQHGSFLNFVVTNKAVFQHELGAATSEPFNLDRILNGTKKWYLEKLYNSPRKGFKWCSQLESGTYFIELAKGFRFEHVWTILNQQTPWRLS